MTRCRFLVPIVPTAVATMLVPAFAPPPPAAASCVALVRYRGADYLGSSTVLDPADLGARVGTGSVPGCNDVITVPPHPPEPATPVPVLRIRGVAPRLAVAVAPGGGRPAVFSPDGVGCPSLVCLRRATARLHAGPSLIAPVAARPGDVIRLTVHVRNATHRRRTVSGVDAVLQGRGPAGRWVSLWHLLRSEPDQDAPPPPVAFGPPFTRDLIGFPAGVPRPVRLPDVNPGWYRLADRVVVRGRPRWITAPLTIGAP